MNILQNGYLQLGLWDMREDPYARSQSTIPEGKDPEKIDSYSYEAQIAAAYAWHAGYEVVFLLHPANELMRHGIVKRCSRYLDPAKAGM